VYGKSNGFALNGELLAAKATDAITVSADAKAHGLAGNVVARRRSHGPVHIWSVRGRPNRARELLSNRAMAETRLPASVTTISPLA
jgi:hypothetical protein